MTPVNFKKLIGAIAVLCFTLFDGNAQSADYCILTLHPTCGQIISSEENKMYQLFPADSFECAYFLLKDQSDIMAVIYPNDTTRLNRQQLIEMFYKVDSGQISSNTVGESACDLVISMKSISAAEWLKLHEQVTTVPLEIIDSSTTPRLIFQTGLNGSMGSSRFGRGAILSAHIKTGNSLIGIGGIWAFESKKYDAPTIFSSGPQTKDIYRYRSLFAYYGRSIQFSEGVFNLSAGFSWESIAVYDFEVRDNPVHLFWSKEIVETDAKHFNGPGLVTAFQLWLFPSVAMSPGLNVQTVFTMKYTTVSFALTLRLGRIYKRRPKDQQ